MNKLLVLSPWSVPNRPRRCGPLDRLTGHCPSGCGAVRRARSTRYEALACRGPCANGACAWVATDYRLSGSTPSNECRCRAFSSASAAANSASVSTSGSKAALRSSMGQRWGHIVSVARLIKADAPQRVTRVPEVDEYKPAYCHAHASTDQPPPWVTFKPSDKPFVSTYGAVALLIDFRLDELC
jgi:hypothetical protein